MTCRKRKRAERLAILMEIEVLNRDRCKECTELAISYENNSVCECPAAVRIRELGEALIQTTPREFQPVREITITQERGLTVEGYEALKRKSVKDSSIAKQFNLSPSSLLRWKRANNLQHLRAKKGKGVELV